MVRSGSRRALVATAALAVASVGTASSELSDAATAAGTNKENTPSLRRNRRLRGAQHVEKQTEPATAPGPDTDLNFMDPFADFDFDQAVPVDDEEFLAMGAKNSPLDLLHGTGASDNEDDRALVQGTASAPLEQQQQGLTNSGSKHGGHFREDINNVDTPQATPYIVNGHRARIPSFVMTLDNRSGQNFRGVCGATMISATHAVTAAHCVSNYYRNDLLDKMDAGYVGPYSPWSSSGGKNMGYNYDVLDVKKVTTHPSHQPGPGSRHDIAVIEFNSPVDTSKYPDFKPMPLCNYQFLDSDNGKQGQVAGMGQTYYGGPKSEQLMEVNVNYVKHATCKSKMAERNMVVTEDMVCFGGGYDNKDSCGGDSGGPMMVDGCLAGVVSWGYKCAEPGYPGVYTSIWHHMSWIQSVVGGSYTLQGRNGSKNAVGKNQGGGNNNPAPSPTPANGSFSTGRCYSQGSGVPAGWVKYSKSSDSKYKKCDSTSFKNKADNLCFRNLYGENTARIWDVCCNECSAYRNAENDADEASLP